MEFRPNIQGYSDGPHFVGLRTVSDCRNSCRVCPALLQCLIPWSRYMAGSKEHRHLLKHPVITSFLCLKWSKLSAHYNSNLAFYSVLGRYYLSCSSVFGRYRYLWPSTSSLIGTSGLVLRPWQVQQLTCHSFLSLVVTRPFTSSLVGTSGLLKYSVLGWQVLVLLFSSWQVYMAFSFIFGRYGTMYMGFYSVLGKYSYLWPSTRPWQVPLAFYSVLGRYFWPCTPSLVGRYLSFYFVLGR